MVTENDIYGYKLTEVKAICPFGESQAYVGLLACILDTDNEITR